MLDFRSPPTTLLPFFRRAIPKGTADEVKVLPHNSLDQVSLDPCLLWAYFLPKYSLGTCCYSLELASSFFFFLTQFYFAKEYETLKRDINKTPNLVITGDGNKRACDSPRNLLSFLVMSTAAKKSSSTLSSHAHPCFLIPPLPQTFIVITNNQSSTSEISVASQY